jgi:hypothetical protein
MDLKEFLEHLLPFPPGELSAQDIDTLRGPFLSRWIVLSHWPISVQMPASHLTSPLFVIDAIGERR